MDFSPEFTAPQAPMLLMTMNELAEEERGPALSLNSNLSDMSRYAEALVAAVALFHYCAARPDSQNKLFIAWQFLAARDGAMSLRNFSTALAASRGLLGRVPTWAPSIDVAGLKAAHKEFNAAFPFAHKMRHSVAHPENYSDRTKDMASTAGISFPMFEMPAGPAVTISQTLMGHTFVSTIDGIAVHYDLSDATAIKVLDVTKAAFAAFIKLTPDAIIAQQIDAVRIPRPQW